MPKPNQRLNTCGCAEGSVGLLVGATVVLGAHLARSEPWSFWEIGAAGLLQLALLAAGQALGRRRRRGIRMSQRE